MIERGRFTFATYYRMINNVMCDLTFARDEEVMNGIKVRRELQADISSLNNSTFKSHIRK